MIFNRPLRANWGIALHAIQLFAKKLRSTFVGQNPRTVLPGRIVTDVASVPAIKIRNPMVLVVFMKARNQTLHKFKILVAR